MLKLAEATGLRTVAEGVEPAVQARALQSLGCHSAQGWTWSKAVPADELGAALAAVAQAVAAGRHAVDAPSAGALPQPRPPASLTATAR